MLKTAVCTTDVMRLMSDLCTQDIILNKTETNLRLPSMLIYERQQRMRLAKITCPNKLKRKTNRLKRVIFNIY